MIDIPVLFEDSYLLVINKPSGVVVNRAQSVHGVTVQDWAEEKVNSKQIGVNSEEERIFVERTGIAHRLDKETTGCLLIAKTPTALSSLMLQFKKREVKKAYMAIVHGKLVPSEGEVRAPVGRLPWNRERFGIVPGGKEAVTRYAVHRFWRMVLGKDTQELSLVELFPETGRTHQIRVHLKHINHPIVGDWQYAGRKTARRDRTWAHRVLLHAYRIEFTHPVTQECLAFEAPIPEDMNRIIKSDGF